MVTELKQTAKNLYETDYNLWVKETAILLETRSFNGLDLENLIEEMLDLSERKKRRLESLLTRLWEHLLKLKYWQSEKDYNQNHWKREVRRHWFSLIVGLKTLPDKGLTENTKLKKLFPS